MDGAAVQIGERRGVSKRGLAARTLMVGAAVAACAGPGAGVALGDVTTMTTFASPGLSSFTVPAGVSSITVTAIGAAGGSDEYTCTGVGGKGASVTATLSVSPGELLAVGVGAVGGPGACGQPAAGGGGFGGGGGGGGTPNGVSLSEGPGAGGGGASGVGVPGFSVGFQSPLIVAGGGGGAGGLFGVNGGDAGSAGGTGGGGGGGAGTATAGGASGAAAGACSGAQAGTAGTFALGGAGGVATGTATDEVGGGGGGGGYFGGGGGGSSCPAATNASGGGGGGGSSFVAQGALTATPTSAAASVTITYDVPTAALSASTLSFAGTQPQGVASAEQSLTVTNNGSAPLVVNSESLSGTDPGDYLLDNRCQSPVQVGQHCVIGVRFDPQAQGASTATLTLGTNAVTQPASVTLSGTGGSLPTGPQGKTGPPGPAGEVELVVCKTEPHHKKKCTTTLVTHPVTFTTSAAHASAEITRGHIVYATGSATRAAGGRWRLSLHSIRPLSAGRYTLTLRGRDGAVAYRNEITIR